MVYLQDHSSVNLMVKTDRNRLQPRTQIQAGKVCGGAEHLYGLQAFPPQAAYGKKKENRNSTAEKEDNFLTG